MMTESRKSISIPFSLALLAVFVSAGTLLGGKPSKGGPPPPGRIHFLASGTDAEGNVISVGGSILADGSNEQLSELRQPS